MPTSLHKWQDLSCPIDMRLYLDFESECIETKTMIYLFVYTMSIDILANRSLNVYEWRSKILLKCDIIETIITIKCKTSTRKRFSPTRAFK